MTAQPAAVSPLGCRSPCMWVPRNEPVRVRGAVARRGLVERDGRRSGVTLDGDNDAHAPAGAGCRAGERGAGRVSDDAGGIAPARAGDRGFVVDHGPCQVDVGRVPAVGPLRCRRGSA